MVEALEHQTMTMSLTLIEKNLVNTSRSAPVDLEASQRLMEDSLRSYSACVRSLLRGSPLDSCSGRSIWYRITGRLEPYPLSEAKTTWCLSQILLGPSRERLASHRRRASQGISSGPRLPPMSSGSRVKSVLTKRTATSRAQFLLP